MSKKDDIHAVLNRVKTSRTNLDLEDGSTKSTKLVTDLSECWTSPKCDDYQTEISTIISDLYTKWQNLEDTLQSAYDGASDDSDSSDGGS